MTQVTIYHNPRCSKSRQTLALLEEHGVEPEVVLYLEDAPSKTTLESLLGKLGLSARELMRRKENVYAELKLDEPTLSEDALLEAMSAHPILMERPVVVSGARAVIGRPPENVLELLS